MNAAEPAAGVAADVEAGAEVSFLDLHCHSSASFDSLSRPEDLVRAALERGLTHLAITDHGRIDGALRAREGCPDGLSIIVGEEVLTADGDCLGLFLERPVRGGLCLEATIEAIHEQGGLAGLPHPFDGLRRSSLAGARRERLEAAAHQADFVEAFNGRVLSSAANVRAAEFAREVGLPGVASSDAHLVSEVAIACTIVRGPWGTPDGLRRALADATLITGRASYLLRIVTPAAKLINRWRGNRRPPAPPAAE